ncbi:hypothetical protein BJV77DRAFT_963776 [Russula vinacea]|nr:hypothetical protein BJV77DRAFT_963776 [Russula vinacea]
MPYDMVTPFPPTDAVSVRALLNFVYLRVIEPCVEGLLDRIIDWESNDFLRAIWAGKLWIAAGGFAWDSTIKQADEQGELPLVCTSRQIPIFLSSFARTFH